jgi:hypothetical protein
MELDQMGEVTKPEPAQTKYKVVVRIQRSGRGRTLRRNFDKQPTLAQINAMSKDCLAEVAR